MQVLLRGGKESGERWGGGGKRRRTVLFERGEIENEGNLLFVEKM